MTRSNIPPKIRRCAMWCHLLNLNLIWIVMASYTIAVVVPRLVRNDFVSVIITVLALLLLFLLISRTLALVFWRTYRHRHPFINESGKEALNFSLSIDLYMLIIFTISFASCGSGSGSSSLIIVGFSSVLILLLLFTHFCLTIFGSIRANAGEIYKCPYTIHFLGN